jgi:hypothetical protein
MYVHTYIHAGIASAYRPVFGVSEHRQREREREGEISKTRRSGFVARLIWGIMKPTFGAGKLGCSCV